MIRFQASFWKSLGLLLASAALGLSHTSAQERDRPPREERQDQPGERPDRPEGQRERADRPRDQGVQEQRNERRPAEAGERARRDATPQPPPERQRDDRPDQAGRINPERMEQLLAFANQHQPGVARLLRLLETRSPDRHARAVQALDRDVRRLEAMQARDPDFHRLALERWKNRSTMDLTLAQIEMQRGEANAAPSEEMVNRLKRLVRQQEELKRKQLHLELDRARARIERLEQQIQAAGELDQAKVDSRVRELMIRMRREAQADSPRPEAGRPGDRRPETAPPSPGGRRGSAGPPPDQRPEVDGPRPPRPDGDRRRDGGRPPEPPRPDRDGEGNPPSSPEPSGGLPE